MWAGGSAEFEGASFTDAWIETFTEMARKPPAERRVLHGRVD